MKYKLISLRKLSEELQCCILRLSFHPPMQAAAKGLNFDGCAVYERTLYLADHDIDECQDHAGVYYIRALWCLMHRDSIAFGVFKVGDEAVFADAHTRHQGFAARGVDGF